MALLLPFDVTAAQAAIATAAQAPEEVTLRTSDGVTAYADLYTTAAGRTAPLIMLFHQGGGSARGEYAEIVPRLLAEFNVLAVDTRGGGTRFGVPNRTVAALRDSTPGYCAAATELEAALRFAKDRGFTGSRFAWGSSFSAALVLRLAAAHPNELAGVLAFSPAAGGPMRGCEPQPVLAQLRVPVFTARPREELGVEWIARLTDTFKSAGIDTYVAENGVHGSSMLVPSRVKGDVEPHWRAVLDFLRRNVTRSAGAAPGPASYAIGVTDAVRLAGSPLRIDILVDSTKLGGRELELAEITFPAGGPAVPHRHGSTELLYVMQGELDHVVNGETRRLSPGMVGIVRSGDTVTHRVGSAGAVRALVIWAPQGDGGRLLKARGGTSVPIATIADHVARLRSLREAWSTAYNAGRLEPLREMYVETAVRMPYDAPAQVGRDSVLAAYTRSFATRAFTPTIRLTAAQVEISGDVAIERGSYDEVLTPKGDGRTLREVGKYVSVLRRGDDGAWRFEWSIFNRDRRPGA